MKLFAAEPFVSALLPWQDHDALAVFAKKIETSVLRDRFGFLNQFSKWNLSNKLDPFPDNDKTLSLQDIMWEQAYYYCNRILKEKLVFAYSGGIDSTAMMASIIAVSIHLTFYFTYENFEVKILLTESSIKENPGFFAWMKAINQKYHFLTFIKTNLNCHESIVQIQNKEYVIVSGFPADQLFGSIVGQIPEVAALYLHDWRKWFEKEDYEAVEQFQSAFTYYDLPIKTLGQFLWFMNFATKWHVVQYFDCFVADQSKLGYFEGFYNTLEFQNWSISHFDELHNYPQTDNIHYKKELKEVIRKMCWITKMEFSCDKKGKIGSWGYSKEIDGDHDKKHPRYNIVEEKDGILNLRRFIDNFNLDYPMSKNYLDKQMILARNCLRFYRKEG